MAYDKVVDSASLDDGLARVANAIREKGGTSAALSFPGGFVNAISAISAGGGATEPLKCKVCDITITDDVGGGSNETKTILTADAFVKEHYAHDGFFAVLVPKTAVGTTTNVVTWLYMGNRNIGSTGCVRYGFAFYNSSASAVAYRPLTAKISGTSYNVALRAKNTGNVDLYVESARIVQAGEYTLFMGCWT